MEDSIKQCMKCKQYRAKVEFYTRSDNNKLCNHCRKCHNIKNRAYYAKNRKYAAASERERNYGISEKQYEALLKSQHGLCKICQRPERVIKGRDVAALAVDHDHATGGIRGLLCDRCNRGIGLLGDDSKRLLQASNYLEGVA